MVIWALQGSLSGFTRRSVFACLCSYSLSVCLHFQLCSATPLPPGRVCLFSYSEVVSFVLTWKRALPYVSRIINIPISCVLMWAGCTEQHSVKKPFDFPVCLTHTLPIDNPLLAWQLLLHREDLQSILTHTHTVRFYHLSITALTAHTPSVFDATYICKHRTPLWLPCELLRIYTRRTQPVHPSDTHILPLVNFYLFSTFTDMDEFIGK